MTLTATLSDDVLTLARRIAATFAALPQVVAVVLSGSQTNLTADERSDIDLYVYAPVAIPAEQRTTIMRSLCDAGEIGNTFWEPGDEWIDRQSGIGIDIMYRTPQWMETQLERVLIHFEASLGYSTCLWHNVRTSLPLEDRTGWFRDLQSWANRPYPLPLRNAILAKNYPVLRQIVSSYMHQLESAVRRHDLVSINHRIAALLASYFDILFAINLLPHPGQKRLVEQVTALCEQRPPHLSQQIAVVMQAMATSGTDSHPDLIARVSVLLDDLDALIHEAGLM